MGNQNEGAGGTAVSALPMLREERDADEPVFCTIFVANRRAPMDAAGFDDQTVERLVQHQFDRNRFHRRGIEIERGTGVEIENGLQLQCVDVISFLGGDQRRCISRKLHFEFSGIQFRK